MLFYGALSFKVCVALFMLLCTYELFAMAGALHHTPAMILAMLTIGLLFAITLRVDLSPWLSHPAVISAVFLWMAWYMAELALKRIYWLKHPLALCVRAVFLFGVCALYLVLLRDGTQGLVWTLWILCIVWVNDTSAYLTGRRFGKHPLAPSVSPRKTIEGAVGALLGSMVAAVLLGLWFFDVAWYELLGFGALASALAQLGDLHESLVKRKFEVKDSGTLFPGHGGVYDRVDSFIFLAPAAYYFVRLLISG